MKDELKFDEVGIWSEIKLEIIKKYAQAYSQILSKQPRLQHVYIDGFAGAGVVLSEKTGEFIPGSPLNALAVEPPFKHHYLVDLKGSRVASLKARTAGRKDVDVFKGDATTVLVNEVIPKVQFKDYRRALCLLDPYGLHLNWEVFAACGNSRAIDLFLNFPIFDINRNALWRNPAAVAPVQAKRLTAFWGDDSWKTAAYRDSPQASLFNAEPDQEKLDNDTVVRAFCERLRRVAGFAHVAKPLPMHIPSGPVVYYLLFASQNANAVKIANNILDKYRKRKR